MRTVVHVATASLQRVFVIAGAVCLALAIAGCLKPVPPPDPDPVPTPNQNLRVVILFESSHQHTRQQLNILNSTKLVTSLNQAVGTDGWRRWDASSIASTGATDETPEWAAIAKSLTLTAVIEPELVLIRGRSQTVNALPESERGVLDLIAKAK